MKAKMIEMLNAKLAAIEAYERGFNGVLVGENTVLRLPAGFIRIIREDNKSKAVIVDLPSATMFSPHVISVIQGDIRDGLGSTPVAMNFREAIAHERHRIAELVSTLNS